MKAMGILLLLSLALFCFSAHVAGKEEDKPDCSEFKDSGTFCTRESNPHCGDDGMTYGNLCAFCKAVEKSGGKLRLYHMGKC
ncbi:serine protease inhibitor Kazal-type 6 isoform X3 [Alligator mississippiensis]|nr:serine protease inhibitor Kazal-type 6 isoform X3 [Alligator mississippiensis]